MQVEIGNYDSFYDAGITFSPEQVCGYCIMIYVFYAWLIISYVLLLVEVGVAILTHLLTKLLPRMGQVCTVKTLT